MLPLASSAPSDHDQEAPLVARTVTSPIGALRLIASRCGLAAILWPDGCPGRVPLAGVIDSDDAILSEAANQLDAYFARRLRRFDLPLDPRGTSFQQAVWKELTKIPYGETRSYQAVAAAIGRPTASRAVGAANARNPLSIVVPCHRVVGSTGGLTGFAGGLDIKRRLLIIEGAASEFLF